MGLPVVIKIGVLIERRGMLLLIEEKKDEKSSYKFNIVKGTFDAKDKSFERTAVRESLEEAGVEIKVKKLFNSFVVKRSDQTIVQLNFLASFVKSRSLSKNKEIENEYIGKASFFQKGQLLKMREEDFISKRAYQSVKKWVAER